MTAVWAARDLRTGARHSGAGAGADVPTVAASLIKLPILLAVLRAVDAGSLRLDAELPLDARHRVGGSGWLTDADVRSASVETLARAMIDSSDNAATNVLLDALGYGEVDAAAAAAGLSGTTLGRHMMDAAARAAGRENLITAHDACAALAALVTGTLLAPASRALAASALRDQHTPGVLPELVPAGCVLGHKTGELDGVRHDAGVLWRDGAPLVAVAVLGTGGSDADLLAQTRAAAVTALAALDLP